MILDEAGPTSATDKSIPHLVVMRDRIIIQEHHHSTINRYMWNESDITHHYSKVTVDFNNDTDEKNN